jgi:hypothetical protein
MKGSVDRYNNSEERKEPHTFPCISATRERQTERTITHQKIQALWGRVKGIIFTRAFAKMR